MSHTAAASAGPIFRSSSRSSMWRPSVRWHEGSTERIAPAIRSSQRLPASRVGGTQRERRLRDRVGSGLKVLPQQEETDRVAAGGADLGEVARHLLAVEAAPPAHRRRGGPVVHADAEAPAHTTWAPARTRS